MRLAVKLRCLRGVTLIEALAAIALLAFGITATMKALSSLSSAEESALRAEEMQRLALQKYDEIIALATLPSGQTEGDFTDRGENRYIWRANRQPTSTTNLDALTVEVSKKDDNFAKPMQVEGLVCNPPASTTGGTQ